MDREVAREPLTFATFNPIDLFAEVKPSPIDGFGLYAKYLIPRGSVWYQPRPQDVLIITKEQWMTLRNSFIPPKTHQPRLVHQFARTILSYSTHHREFDLLMFPLDNGKYVNHSPDANSAYMAKELMSVALRDIQPGEEITEDYSKYAKTDWALFP